MVVVVWAAAGIVVANLALAILLLRRYLHEEPRGPELSHRDGGR